ncbi:pilus assembly protein PilP [Methylococcus sp. EFPC2]|uniref:pilus assembly protein PilP n=1 Tax=Methylococcus sp. EFPC2 TaxID=2812648 RepID=UPI001967AB20|nr:pilus assembly protein PilP [Methylococcus sp. EFPC2]QSA96198.1 pilus assembly protein PilP [Methylococcus sp. EFPC2]
MPNSAGRASRDSLRLTWVLLMVSCIAGCASDDMSDLKDYVADVKARQKSAVEPLPEVKTVEPFVFRPDELHDPFVLDEKAVPAEEVKAESGIRPDTARPKEELESYELDSLRMTGTLLREGVLWALVRANDGTIHRVKSGNYMGRNFGKILRIKDDQIELLEIISDTPGTWRERKASLDLAEASGGKK